YPRENYRHTLTCQFRYKISGYKRRIGNRFVEMPDQSWKKMGNFRSNNDFMVICPECLCDHLRIRQFIVETIAAFKADRVGFARPIDKAGNRRYDRAGIDSATQESTQRHVADKPYADGFEQLFPHLLDPFVFGSIFGRALWHIPIFLFLHPVLVDD